MHERGGPSRLPEDDGLDDGLLRAFCEATDALVCVLDDAGRFSLVNRAVREFTGRSASELLGRPFWEVLVVPEHVGWARAAVARVMTEGGTHAQEGDWLTGDGSRRRVAMRNTVLVDGDGRHYAMACVGVDVTDDRHREAALTRRARTDPLTGLANRGALFEALRERLARAGGCAVLFCDLDGFKTVNDDHGHAVGDLLLAEVAARLVGVARAGDLVARFGGDEFVILSTRPDEGALAELAEDVVARMEAPFPGPAGPLRVGVSVGIAVGRPGDVADDVIGRADRAMYGVKTHRRRHAPRGDVRDGGG